MKISDFIVKANFIHGNLFDYSEVPQVITYKTFIDILCKKHGKFTQLTANHLVGKGCVKCSYETNTDIHFVEKSKLIHSDSYDYSSVKYINNHIGVDIICKKHGIFNQIPKNHLKGTGCPICALIYKGNKQKKSIDKFIEQANIVHKNKYDYSFSDYKNNKSKIKIICPEHGEFLQNPSHHLNGSGCPSCRESKGEAEISLLLKKYEIDFVKQKKFNGCKYKQLLPFDFYLQLFNCCIEFDGEQHYKSKTFFGGEDEFENIKKRDLIKEEYCLKNNINFFRIMYLDNIEKKLNEIINKLKNEIDNK